ncbi:hypothetical protein AAFN86_24055 [Roseomonas sp. CAU 1739]|uniref:hypothetical protein n=1 Tax=Roseomonas sp. CAU 1739 TaxID=3140364 RepID=UPI00325B0EF6
MSGEIIYVAELDIPAAALPPFYDWYAGRHAPDLYQLGFRTCTSYRGVEGSMDVIDVYEAANWDIVASEGYRRMKARDAHAAPACAGRTDWTHTIYEYNDAVGADRHPLLDADWITMARFAGDEAAEDALAAWLLQEGEAAYQALGARSVRLLHRGRDHPTLKSRRARCALLAEWAVEPPASGRGMSTLPGHLLAMLSPDAAFMGYRLYPWPDDVSLRQR